MYMPTKYLYYDKGKKNNDFVSSNITYLCIANYIVIPYFVLVENIGIWHYWDTYLFL